MILRQRCRRLTPPSPLVVQGPPLLRIGFEDARPRGFALESRPRSARSSAIVSWGSRRRARYDHARTCTAHLVWLPTLARGALPSLLHQNINHRRRLLDVATVGPTEAGFSSSVAYGGVYTRRRAAGTRKPKKKKKNEKCKYRQPEKLKTHNDV